MVTNKKLEQRATKQTVAQLAAQKHVAQDTGHSPAFVGR